jgi:hypothetical protein
MALFAQCPPRLTRRIFGGHASLCAPCARFLVFVPVIFTMLPTSAVGVQKFSHIHNCHFPGRRIAPLDDWLQRMIQ